MNGLRPISGLLLAVLMALTSVTMAVARGQDRMSQSVEICAEFGTAWITLDGSGQPTRPHHVCPDCLGGVTALDLPGVTSAPLPITTTRRAVFAEKSTNAASQPLPSATARGPPSLI